MSTNFSIKPVGAPAGTAAAAPASEAADSAVATDLPAARSVTVADASANVRDDSDVYLSHQTFIDRAAGAIVYQVVDNRTNLVLQQFPDNAVLRRRAYFRALDLTRSTPTRLLATDRTA
jgi:hypothetical protein